MAKRTAVAAPAAAIDDDLPWDKPKSDDETANLFDTGGERGLEDGANDEPSELEDRLRASLASADESDLPAREEDPTTEILEKKPVGDILTDIALQGISGRMRKKPLPAHSNEWVVATYRRMDGLRDVTSDQAERAQFSMDCTLLKLSADRRGISVDDSVGEPAASSDYEIVDDLGGSANTGQDLAPEQISTENVLGVHEKTGALTLGVIIEVDVNDIEPDPDQARDEGADDELAASIKANGFYANRAIELRVHPKAGQLRAYPHSQQLYRYMIVDGERRFRGAIAAGLAQIPATITDAAADEGDRLVRQVVMNEGKRLKPMEEARTYKRIMEAKHWSIQQLADHLGKSKSTVSDRVAMADLPEPFAAFVLQGTIGAAAAPVLRPLAGLPAGAIARIAETIASDYVWKESVRENKSVPLDEFKNLVADAVDVQLREIDNNEVANEYKGKTATIGKKLYAVDVAAYDAAERKVETAARKADPDEQRRAKAQADQNARYRKELDRRAEDERKEKEREAAFKKVFPAVMDAIGAKLTKSPVGTESAMADLIRGALHVGAPQRSNSEKALGKGRSAEDLVRQLAFSVISSQGQWYGAWKSFPKLAKQFGVDVDALLKADAPAKAATAKKSSGKKASKKKGR